jgi:hypothetical protein
MKKNGASNIGRKKQVKASASKPYWEMTTAELRKATAEFDREFVGDTFGQPTPEQMAKFEKAKRKRGRPRNGMGSKTISVTVEAGLLAKTDRLAKKLQVPRAVLIARGLQAVLGEKTPS